MMNKEIDRLAQRCQSLERSAISQSVIIEQLEQLLSAKFSEVDDNIEKLWYAPGGPAAAALIVKYDHNKQLNE